MIVSFEKINLINLSNITHDHHPNLINLIVRAGHQKPAEFKSNGPRRLVSETLFSYRQGACGVTQRNARVDQFQWAISVSGFFRYSAMDKVDKVAYILYAVLLRLIRFSTRSSSRTK